MWTVGREGLINIEYTNKYTLRLVSICGLQYMLYPCGCADNISPPSADDTAIGHPCTGNRDLKARFLLGEFVRATRSENKNPAT